MAYSTQMAAALSGATTGQIRSWRQHRGAAGPFLRPEVGIKPRALYSFRDILALRAFARLREEFSLQALRRAVGTLRELGEIDHLSAKRRTPWPQHQHSAVHLVAPLRAERDTSRSRLLLCGSAMSFMGSLLSARSASAAGVIPRSAVAQGGAARSGIPPATPSCAPLVLSRTRNFRKRLASTLCRAGNQIDRPYRERASDPG